jgi:hypothetical protein
MRQLAGEPRPTRDSGEEVVNFLEEVFKAP